MFCIEFRFTANHPAFKKILNSLKYNKQVHKMLANQAKYQIVSSSIEDYSGDDSEFQIKKKKNKVNKNSKIQGRSSGYWTTQQNQLYLRLIQKYQQILENRLARRKLKIFEKISQDFERRKTGQQVRGHHKKLVQKFKTIDNIVLHFQENASIKQDRECSVEEKDQQSSKEQYISFEKVSEEKNWDWTSVFDF